MIAHGFYAIVSVNGRNNCLKVLNLHIITIFIMYSRIIFILKK